jgi:intracellular septation protein A
LLQLFQLLFVARKNGRMQRYDLRELRLAAVMLWGGWLARYMPSIVTQNVSERVLTATGYTWAALMIVLGLLNIYIAMSFSIEIWTWWISVGAIGAKIAALIIQFIVFRAMVRRNMRINAPASS